MYTYIRRPQTPVTSHIRKPIAGGSRERTDARGAVTPLLRTPLITTP